MKERDTSIPPLANQSLIGLTLRINNILNQYAAFNLKEASVNKTQLKENNLKTPSVNIIQDSPQSYDNEHNILHTPPTGKHNISNAPDFQHFITLLISNLHSYLSNNLHAFLTKGIDSSDNFSQI